MISHLPESMVPHVQNTSDFRVPISTLRLDNDGTSLITSNGSFRLTEASQEQLAVLGMMKVPFFALMRTVNPGILAMCANNNFKLLTGSNCRIHTEGDYILSIERCDET